MQLTNEQKLNLLPEGAYFGDPITGAMLDHIIAALRAQADARPVAWIHDEGGPTETVHAENHGWEGKWTPLYTHPEASAPGLSDDEIDAIEREAMQAFADATGVHVSNLVTDTDCNPSWRRAYARAILTRASAATVAEPGVDERAALSDADLIEVGRTYDIHPDSALSFARDVLARAAQSGQRAGVAEVVLDYLKAHAVPSYQVKVTTNPESASLCQQQIVTVDCGSWGNLIEHIQRAAAPTQQQERRE